MTSSSDTVVIGGGIVGVCTALQLQRTGRSVTVIERDVPGDAASGHNGGMFWPDCVPTGTPEVIQSLPRMLTDPDSALVLRWRYLPSLAPWLLRFALASRETEVARIARAIYQLSSRCFDHYRPLVAGKPAEEILRVTGSIDVYLRRSSLNLESRLFRMRRETGIRFEVMDLGTLATRIPRVAERIEAAVLFPNTNFTIDPGGFTRTLLETFVENGGRVLRSTVTDLERRDGHVERVITSDGSISAKDVVIAAGPWSPPLARRLGTDVPLEAERGYGVDFPDPGITLDVPLLFTEYHVGVTPFRSGLRLTGVSELASLNAPANFRLPERLIRTLKRVLPEFRTDGGRFWMRARPSTPDSLPVIGRAPHVQNAYFAFGHGHKGLGTGAITGKLIQELMDGQPTTVDVAPYSPGRFSLKRTLFA